MIAVGLMLHRIAMVVFLVETIYFILSQEHYILLRRVNAFQLSARLIGLAPQPPNFAPQYSIVA